MSEPSIVNHDSPTFDDSPRHRNADASILLTAVKALGSLRFTVALFVPCILLVFFGTLAQVDEGILTVVRKYFRSIYVFVPLQLFFPRTTSVGGSFPFPGGLLLGSLLLLNLLAAHVTRFFSMLSSSITTTAAGMRTHDSQLIWKGLLITFKRSGVIVLHAGLVVMMLGELITWQFANEGTLTVEKNGSCNYVEERAHSELAIIRHESKQTDDVVVIPDRTLRRQTDGSWIQNDALPVDVQVVRYMVNSAAPTAVPPDSENLADTGHGTKWLAVPKREGTGVDSEQRIDMASAYVTLREKGSGKKLGTFLISLWFSAILDQPQQFEVNGRTYDMSLRFKRSYKPYTITLNKFTHEVYEGTNTPKNFASSIVLTDPAHGTDLETTISMNNPLRYRGETFYQSSFLPGDEGTVLQVVRNPAWQMPYISCILVGLGMLLHFCIKLVSFVRKHTERGLDPRGSIRDFSLSAVLVPVVVVSCAAFYLVVAVLPPQDPPGGMRLHDFSKLPVVDGGRTKPLQSDALNDLQMISSRHTFVTPDKESHGALKWYLDVLTSRINKKSQAEDYEVFRIDNDQLLNLLQLPNKPEFYRYSIREIAPKFDVLEKEIARAKKVEKEDQTLFDIKLLQLNEHLQLYMALVNLQSPSMIPAMDGKEARPLGDALQRMMAGGPDDPNALSLFRMLSAYSSSDAKTFNEELDTYHARLKQAIPDKLHKAEFEVFFNDFEPFYHCTVLYVIVFVLSCGSWITLRQPQGRAAFWLCLLTFLVHTWAIGARMYIQARPPITNLYSTAICISWAAVGMGLILDALYRNGFGVALGSIMGFLGVLIAHNLSNDGDTMEMLQAVLDTNFWLATHVVVVNLGYAATLVSGFIGIAFLLACLVQYLSGGALPRELFSVLSQKLYGILCYATLCSFVGTVLGGIWADQSWGRFWGWDPKENGALMIVLMNALILHARWGGLVKQRGIAVLSLFGNIITAWSWFGVNLLGVGLHAYGFKQGTRDWLIFFCLTQVALIILGVMPFMDYWRTAGPQKAKVLAEVDRSLGLEAAGTGSGGSTRRRRR